MILAAGRGERLRPLTDDIPKPLVEVAGITLLERHLRRLARAGIERVVINLGWCGARIPERIGSGARFGLTVCYSPEDDEILETGGGLRRALPMLGGSPFWALNGDVYTDYALPSISLERDAQACLVLVPRPDYRARGDFDLDGGTVRNGANPEYVFSGMAYYRPEFIARLPESRVSIAPLLREAAGAGELAGVLYDGDWEDVGTPQRLAALEQRLATG